MTAVAYIGAEEIPKILRERGWTPRAVDDRTWRVTLNTAAGDARMIARHAGSWLYLAVLPFLAPGSTEPWGKGRYPQRFLGRILAVNHNLTLVKFALDEEGDLCLRAELPTESLQRREIETALNHMALTTEQYRVPIRDALLDAGRAESPRPSLLPEAPRSEPPGAATDAALPTPEDALIPTHPAALPD